MSTPVAGLSHHPAAEIVAIALRKICKLANGKKHMELVEQCAAFLENVNTLIPATVQRSDEAAEQQPDPSLQAALSEAAEEAAEAATKPVAAAASGPPSHANSSNLSTSKSVSQLPSVASSALSPEEAQQRAASIKAHFEAADIEEAAHDFGVGTAPPPEGEAAAVAAPADAPAADSAPPHASLTTDGPHPTMLRSGVSAVEAVHNAATADLLADIVPRTETALPDAVCSRVLAVLRAAIETGRPNIMEVALDCIQKLIAFKFLQVVSPSRPFFFGRFGTLQHPRAFQPPPTTCRAPRTRLI